MRTVNYVSITRTHSSVKETLIIDPLLFIPPFLRPPLTSGETEETRNNLRLESTHGHVIADVTLVENSNTETQPSQSKNRVKMLMRSTHGGVTAKIVSLPFVLCSRLSLTQVSLSFVAWATPSRLFCASCSIWQRRDASPHPTQLSWTYLCELSPWLC